MKEIRQVAKAVVFNGSGQMLLLRRSDTAKNRPGKLDLPGGKVDEEEDSLAAVIREIKEEIDVDIQPEDAMLGYASTGHYDDLSTIRFLYIIYLRDEPEINLSYEHDKYSWASLNEVIDTYDHPNWNDGIKYLKKYGFIG